MAIFLLNKGSKFMKKILLASVLSVLPFMANAENINIKPVIGVDYSYYAKTDLQNGWDKDVEDNYQSFSGVVGVKMNDVIGIEAFYQQSLEEDSPYWYDVSSEFNAFGVDALAYIPLNERIDFIPSVGIGRYEVEVNIDDWGSDSEDGLGLRAGLGMQINFNENIGLRISGRYVHLDDFESADNIMEFSTGLRFTF